MPGKDGTGPFSGQGRGGGRGQGQGRGNNRGMGPQGLCVCPKCGAESPHNAGVPCQKMQCPQCGTVMIRK